MTMRFAVLVSGSGTNLGALLEAQAAGRLAPAEVVVVISNRPGVQALARAAAAGVPALVVDHRAYPDRDAFEAALSRALGPHRVDGLVLAGFMRVLGAGFVGAWAGRILNTHPSLLPAFAGAHGVRDAIAHGVKQSGCTIHFVDAGLDAGPIVFQAAVEVRDDDDEASLHARILAREHELLPRAVRLLAAGRLHLDGRRVRVAPE